MNLLAPLFAATLLAASLGCSGAPGATPPPPRPSPSIDPAAPPAVDWSRAIFRPYESLAHGFSIPLPDDPGWSITDSKDTWFIASHPATHTEIVARILSTDGLANRARCETRARDLRKLPEREGATIVERRRVDLPSGFDTILEVGLLPTDPGQPITGYALAIGGWSKRCFVYSLTTTAHGRGAEEAVGDRLALFVERSFLHLTFPSDLTPTVPREKPPL